MSAPVGHLCPKKQTYRAGLPYDRLHDQSSCPRPCVVQLCPVLNGKETQQAEHHCPSQDAASDSGKIFPLTQDHTEKCNPHPKHEYKRQNTVDRQSVNADIHSHLTDCSRKQKQSKYGQQHQQHPHAFVFPPTLQSSKNPLRAYSEYVRSSGILPPKAENRYAP